MVCPMVGPGVNSYARERESGLAIWVITRLRYGAALGNRTPDLFIMSEQLRVPVPTPGAGNVTHDKQQE